MSKRLAFLLSRLFDPAIEIPLILMWTASMAYLNGYRWRFLLLMFFLDALIPGIIFLWGYIYKKHGDWDIRRKQDRLPLFLATLTCHAAGVMVAYLLDRHPLAELLMAFWLLGILLALITVVWKISLHSAVNATLVTMLFWFVSFSLWPLFALPLVVGYARVVGRYHTPLQVLAGIIIPPLFLSSLFFLWGVRSSGAFLP